VDDPVSLATLQKAVESGINFFDTADVYGDGHSERLLAALRKQNPGHPLIIATKAGRRLDPHISAGYNRANLTAFVERSLQNLETETLDLLQLHCPPSEVYDRAEVFEILDRLVSQGKVRHYGVSVERVSEALRAVQYPNVETVQIIFNIFRQKPAEEFFGEAQRRKTGILARVPLASGLLTGKLTRQSTFHPDDHRNYNRHGESFDQGETFAGVDYETGLQAVEELRGLVPAGQSMAQFALRWILMHPEVSCAIPGARTPAQAADNAAAADLPELAPDTMQKILEIYDHLIRDQVHSRW
jgi:aryl-alcohol dehydrogenase-like predicted oxidoreductase